MKNISISNFPICHWTEVKIGGKCNFGFCRKSYGSNTDSTLVLVPDTDTEFRSHTKKLRAYCCNIYIVPYDQFLCKCLETYWSTLIKPLEQLQPKPSFHLHHYLKLNQIKSNFMDQLITK